MLKKPKSKFRKLDILVRKKKIDLLMWAVHFGYKMGPVFPTCRDCADFKAGICPGGKDPIKCMQGQTARIEIF